jgi:hypothetical protein
MYSETVGDGSEQDICLADERECCSPDMLGSIEFLASAGVIFTLGKLSQIMRDSVEFFLDLFQSRIPHD